MWFGDKTPDIEGSYTKPNVAYHQLLKHMLLLNPQLPTSFSIIGLKAFDVLNLLQLDSSLTKLFSNFAFLYQPNKELQATCGLRCLTNAPVSYHVWQQNKIINSRTLK